MDEAGEDACRVTLKLQNRTAVGSENSTLMFNGPLHQLTIEWVRQLCVVQNASFFSEGVVTEQKKLLLLIHNVV